mmetsp:Transcript_127059/g.230742  ORF Transcript_127059/g.230742 Transcript_127059/m.230742 type:complete len:639 (-) Transcript_127059:67-1983(-)
MRPSSTCIAAMASPWLVFIAVLTHLTGTGASRTVIKAAGETNPSASEHLSDRSLSAAEMTSPSLLQRSHKRRAHANLHAHAGLMFRSESEADLAAPPSSHTLVCCAIAVAGALAMLLLWPVRDRMIQASKSAEEGQAQGQPRERLCLLDNAKVCAQFLVIWNHLLYYTMMGEYVDSVTVMSGSQDLLKRLLYGNRAVMMPAICFISGICSQGTVTPRKLHRFVQYLVAPMLMWVCFCKPVIVSTLMTMDQETLWQQLRNLATLQAFHEEWYLEALVIWRGLAFLLWSNMKPSVAFVSMMGLSCLAGYYNLSGGPMWFMKMSEAMGFLPYFAVGYVVPFHAVCRAVPRPSNGTAIFCGVLAILWAYVWMPMLFQTPFPDGHGDYKCCEAGQVFKKAHSWDYRLYWVSRIAKVVLELPPMLALIFVVLPRGETPLTWVGPHTLYPFLFHLLAHTWRSRLLALFPLPVLTSTSSHALVILANLPYCLSLICIFASRPWRWLFGWCLSPTWLDPIMIAMGAEREKKSGSAEKTILDARKLPAAKTAEKPQEPEAEKLASSRPQEMPRDMEVPICGDDAEKKQDDSANNDEVASTAPSSTMAAAASDTTSNPEVEDTAGASQPLRAEAAVPSTESVRSQPPAA